MLYKISNPTYIKRLVNYKSYLDDVAEMSLNITDVQQFVDDFYEFDDASDWPLAVNPTLIINPDNIEECRLRAKNVVDSVIERKIAGLNILDFGSGDGTIAEEMVKRKANVVAYDLTLPKTLFDYQPSPPEKQAPTITTNWSSVADWHAPFDLILLYDVLDHCTEEPVEVLKRLRPLLKKDGTMIIRCHPWISRHGGHCYTKINRAWVHLLFTEEQLRKRGCDPMPIRKIIHPLYTYKKWIEEANYKIIKEDKITESVEDYFTNNELFKNIIYKHFKDSPFEDYRKGKGDLARVMGFHFIDYILSV